MYFSDAAIIGTQMIHFVLWGYYILTIVVRVMPTDHGQLVSVQTHFFLDFFSKKTLIFFFEQQTGTWKDVHMKHTRGQGSGGEMILTYRHNCMKRRVGPWHPFLSVVQKTRPSCSGRDWPGTEHNKFLFTACPRTQTRKTFYTRVPEVSIRDCTGTVNNRCSRWPKLSTINVTAKATCERLVFVAGPRGLVHLFTMSSAPAPPPRALFLDSPVLFFKEPLKNTTYSEPVV